MVLDGFPQVRLVVVAAPGIGAEGDVAGGELRHIQNGAMIEGIEYDAELAAAVRASILEQQDIERCAGNAIEIASVALACADFGGGGGAIVGGTFLSSSCALLAQAAHIGTASHLYAQTSFVTSNF